LYFSILEVIAGGETQMSKIADKSGVNINSIGKYLDELTNYYQLIDREKRSLWVFCDHGGRWFVHGIFA